MTMAAESPSRCGRCSAKASGASGRGPRWSNGTLTSRPSPCCSMRRRAPGACWRQAMPLALPDLQAAFAAHLVGGDRADLIDAIAGDPAKAAARLSIHRHHVAHSLAAALAATFGAVQALVGEGFFRGLADAFVAAELPRQPVLADYGA